MLRLSTIVVIGIALLTGGVARAQNPADKQKQVAEKIDLGQLKVKGDTDSFVLPVPSEIVQRVRQGNYGGQIADALDLRPHQYKGLPPWKAALTLGASLSDVLLAVDSVPPEKIAAGLDDIAAGMKYLKLSEPRIRKVTDLRSAVAGNSIDKAKLVAQFDELRADLISKGRQELGAQNFGLLVVGGWARAANLTARLAQAHPAALAELEVLKVRSVIDTFLRLVGNGPDVQGVVASLKELLPIASASRPQAPTPAEAVVIQKATSDILSFIQ